jgi:hypothetical protein
MNNFTPSSDERETPPVVNCHDETSNKTIRDGCDVDSAGGELFAISETKSPRLKWMERHHLTVEKNEFMDNWDYRVKHGMAIIGYGATPDAALVAAAKSLNIPLWNESGVAK